ncbi:MULTISPECIES: homocysteine S-methyltransferase family protein [Syntrophotalea]|jgi:5-methyltetrahydrofolate--homocysteine methyltransferase|uniref:Methionine synthase n=1 Tax=Syntrophotalea acetylenica TaxID=29542 RepID=A0A1L3GF05_SYNAC|nr:homocysteine S-methyltransferase family protein [Syntrophotalea acetylenica]APG24415.1 5-methyltetrahydrofolate--homocysteine methyltransferase [Syntrophotalea acetylenica]APG45000.1 5-methyltetrahydrofolate--homocysteine methyltransferase [Syntrophotalea acetylenica]
MADFVNAIKQRVLILDGAMGTMLQERGLKAGGCPEEMNLSAPHVVEAVHREYAEAGADIIVSNSFGGSRLKLAHYGLEHRVREINAGAVELARRAAGEGRFVAASMGPTGRFLQPVGDAGFDEMVEVFGEQVRAFAEAGADLITLETFLDIAELRAAVIACHEFSDLPVMALMTFEDAGRSVLGTSPEAAAVTLEGLGVTVVGSNCGLGVEGIHDVLARMRKVCATPLIAQPNAGLPQLIDGRTVFNATPQDMVAYHQRLLDIGVRVIGGCCGTTPAHISAMRQALQGLTQDWTPPPRRCLLSSRTSVAEIGGQAACAIIGERINPTGRKAYAQELREGKTAYVRREAQVQVAAGAHLLDVNCGAPGVDEPAALERAVLAIEGVTQVPLVLDSSDPAALERGLKVADGKVLINSVSGEAKSLQGILPLARKYGAAVIALALDGSGIPETAEERLSVARRIRDAALQSGIAPQDIVVDCLTLTVSAEQKRAMETIRTLRLVRDELGMATALGVSNISFGLPCRPVLSSVFFAMALEAGLSAAIINPRDERMMDAYRAAMVLLGKDLRAERYIAAYADVASAPPASATPDIAVGIRERLSAAIIEGDKDGVVTLVEQALGEGLDTAAISNEGLLPGLEEVGRRFGENRIFLPQVMQSAETMQAAFARLKQEMHGSAVASLGRILMATVEGDIHDIGKNIVCTLLENHGFEVIDLGKNVPAERILQKALELQVDAVGLSALMTTTIEQMRVTIARLREAGVKVLTMVGGAVVTQEYADEIGADMYAADALEAVAKAKQLLADRR